MLVAVVVKPNCSSSNTNLPVGLFVKFSFSTKFLIFSVGLARAKARSSTAAPIVVPAIDKANPN